MYDNKPETVMNTKTPKGRSQDRAKVAGGQDYEVAAQDDCGQPWFDGACECQDQERSAEQDFVGDGIEIRAEAGRCGVAPGEEAVDHVGDADDDEQRNDGAVAMAEHQQE